MHRLLENSHDAGLLMAYLPSERLLIEADVFTPGPATAPGPSPDALNLYENIRRLELQVGRIAPIHGRMAPYSDLLKAVGKEKKDAPSDEGLLRALFGGPAGQTLAAMQHPSQ
jgi:hypothetical protein